MEENQLQAGKEAQKYSVPWSIGDTWLGVTLLVLLNIGMLAALLLGIGRQAVQSVGILFVELVYLLPVALIFIWRHIHWKHLGFGKFTANVMGLGCGFLLAGYVVIHFHNTVLDVLGIETQKDRIIETLQQLESPIWFFLVGAVVAPIVEEIFFRGFLFQGFRQKYGWVSAIIISSAIFSAAHLDPVSFIPTFVMGCVLAYVYHRSNSVWPGIIFHAAINSFSLAVVYIMLQNPSPIPS